MSCEQELQNFKITVVCKEISIRNIAQSDPDDKEHDVKVELEFLGRKIEAALEDDTSSSIRFINGCQDITFSFKLSNECESDSNDDFVFASLGDPLLGKIKFGS